MRVAAYYNEIDPDAAAIIRQLIDDGVIAPGDVDTRSIIEVQPDDLRPYTQCHFFAGGGLWSVAARLAGWPDARPLWTGSCPCQPFSVAGKGAGADDPRHLWPDFFRLIRARRPDAVVGEQVAGKAGYGWFDGVRADLASEGYAGRGVDIPSCAVDAPHIRQRLYWVALADADSCRRPRWPQASEWPTPQRTPAERADDVEHATRLGWREGRPEPELRSGRPASTGADASGVTQCGARRNGSWWADHEWIVCHDGKARRTKPGVPLLVDGLPGRVGLWRVAGNAINPVLAAEVIGALMDVTDRRTAA